MFKLKCSLVNTTPTTEYIKGTNGETYLYGEALTLASGKLTKCEANVKPEYICLTDTVCKNDERIPVMRIMDFYLFGCPVDGDASTLKAGDKVTLDSDGLGVTSTTSGGVAEIIETDGNTVTVKF